MRFVRLSGPWGVGAALVSDLALTSLGGVAAALATGLCLAALLLMARGLSIGLEAPGRAVQQKLGALGETFAQLAEAAPELRCFGLEEWAAGQIDEASRAYADAQRAQAVLAGWMELLHAAAIDTAAPILRALLERGRLGEAEARLDTLFDAAQAGGGVPLSAAPAIRFAAPAPCHVAPDERLALSGPVRHRQDHAGRDAARPARGGAGPDRDRRA